MSGGLNIELESGNVLEIFLGNDSQEINKAIGRLCHDPDAGIEEGDAFAIYLFIGQMQPA